MSDQLILAEQDAGVLTITFNRPDVLNAFNDPMTQQLLDTFKRAERDAAVRCVVLTGAGRGFSSGQDLAAFVERQNSPHPVSVREHLQNTYNPVVTRIRQLEKPVIAAINGFAMGGGFMLVERTDLRVAVPEAIFEVSEAKRWLLGGYNHGHVANLPYPVAMEMALGFRFTAERFHQIGFLNRLVSSVSIQ